MIDLESPVFKRDTSAEHAVSLQHRSEMSESIASGGLERKKRDSHSSTVLSLVSLLLWYLSLRQSSRRVDLFGFTGA